jgi:hypothetical protein
MIAACHEENDRMVIPSCSSAWRIFTAMSIAPGVSLCTQIVSIGVLGQHV